MSWHRLSCTWYPLLYASRQDTRHRDLNPPDDEAQTNQPNQDPLIHHPLRKTQVRLSSLHMVHRYIMYRWRCREGSSITSWWNVCIACYLADWDVDAMVDSQDVCVARNLQTKICTSTLICISHVTLSDEDVHVTINSQDVYVARDFVRWRYGRHCQLIRCLHHKLLKIEYMKVVTVNL
jgi:hypothetical protein